MVISFLAYSVVSFGSLSILFINYIGPVHLLLKVMLYFLVPLVFLIIFRFLQPLALIILSYLMMLQFKTILRIVCTHFGVYVYI